MRIPTAFQVTALLALAIFAALVWADQKSSSGHWQGVLARGLPIVAVTKPAVRLKVGRGLA